MVSRRTVRSVGRLQDRDVSEEQRDAPVQLATEARVGTLVRETLVATLPGEARIAGLVREALVAGVVSQQYVVTVVT